MIGEVDIGRLDLFLDMIMNEMDDLELEILL